MPRSEIVCRGLVRRFGDRAALDGFDLDVASGERVVVTGPNGAGKTTLLRVLATVLRPGGGSVSVAGHDLPRGAGAARRELGYLGHEPALYGGLSALENLGLHTALHGAPAAAASDALARVGLSARGREPVSSLSRGMRQRVALARAILHRPRLLLLDEPTAGLDEEGRAALDDVLGTPGLTAVVATHEPGRFAAVAGRSVELAAGRAV